MNSTPILHANKPYAKARSLFFFGLATLVISAYLLIDPQQAIIVKLLGWSFLFLALACFHGIFTLSSIDIYSDRLELESIFGLYKQRVLFTEIAGWEEREMKRYRRGVTTLSHVLTLHTSRSKIRIASRNYDNYDQIKEMLIAGKAKIE